MSTKRIFYMKAFNLVLTGLLLGIIVWLLVTLILGVIYQPEYSNDIKVTVNFNNKPVEGTETVETTRQVPVTCPFSGETKTSEVKTVVKKTKSEPSERKVVVTEDAFKETMQQVAYTARQEAQNEYDKNFATLLTILTIFGIAWPVIIALLQFKFNEKEIQKISDLEKQVQKTKTANDNLICSVKENVYKMYIMEAEHLLIKTLDLCEDTCSYKVKMLNIQTPLVISSTKEAGHITAICFDLLQTIHYYFSAFDAVDFRKDALNEHKNQLLKIGIYIDNMTYNYGKYLTKYQCNKDIADFILEQINCLENNRERHYFVVDLIKNLQTSYDNLMNER